LILVHICCAVDSHFFLKKLLDRFPSDKLVGFFYDPNIHPYSEYYLRFLDVKRSCDLLDLELIEGDYDYDGWFKVASSYESEPEKGLRCSVCFDYRLEASAKKAVELGIDKVTTTLMMSPKKSIEQLKSAGDFIEQKYGLEFLSVDFRKSGGTQEQFALAKKDMLYKQDYCGCLYALNKQRDSQKRVANELFSPISKQVLPGSIEQRVELYEKRVELESQGIEYSILKEKFLNYRLLYGLLKIDQNVELAHILPYSMIQKGYTKFTVENKVENIYIANRENIRLITLSTYNSFTNREFESVEHLIYNPPSFSEELNLRSKIVSTPYSLGSILVVEDVKFFTRYEFLLDTTTYEDVKEILVKLG
jgi:predicted adenine nucleotide alpha hydrolase (AANH) superfamily ATPase